MPVWEVGLRLATFASGPASLRRLCGAGRFGGYTVVAKQEPRHGGGVVSRARGQIGFSEDAAAAVRLAGWVVVDSGGLGDQTSFKQKRHRGAKCPIIVIIASTGWGVHTTVRGDSVYIH